MNINFAHIAGTAYQPSNSQINTSDNTTLTGAILPVEKTASAFLSFGQDSAAITASGLLSSPLASQDESRAAHIAAISRSISAGTYFVPAYEVASSILDSLF